MDNKEQISTWYVPVAQIVPLSIQDYFGGHSETLELAGVSLVVEAIRDDLAGLSAATAISRLENLSSAVIGAESVRR